MNNPNEWIYECEGGSHVIFRYHPTTKIDGNNDQTQYHRQEQCQLTVGHLLRLIKKDIYYSRIVCHNKNDEDDAHLHQQSERTHESMIQQQEQQLPQGNDHSDDDHFDQMIATILYPYVDIPKAVILDWTFLYHLSSSCLRCNKWFNDKDDTKVVTFGHRNPKGWIIPDYRIYDTQQHNIPSAPSSISSSPTNNSSNSFSIELKPKGGYRTFSPFVHELRTAKLFQSRFTLQQQLYHNRIITSKAWMNHDDTRSSISSNQMNLIRSSYDPLDLFSNDIIRINKAISALLITPQNNLFIYLSQRIPVLNEKRSSSF